MNMCFKCFLAMVLGGLLPLTVNAQTYNVSGRVVDSLSGESLPFASCVNLTTMCGTPSNNYGHFAMKVNKGEMKLSVSNVGYETYERMIDVTSDTSLVVRLVPKMTNLNEVVVSTVVPQRNQVLMGKTTLSQAFIKSMPSLVGEPDLLKSISFMPGVSLGREGYSNVFVRGGDRGQNLMLLDGIKIYNANHYGGFISMFNTDVVKSVDVYKGGFPAQYGGRASSVIDIVTKDGDREKMGVRASIGTLSSTAFFESPVGSNLSLSVAGRLTYYGLLKLPSKISFENSHEGDYYSYTIDDLNAKLKWNFCDNQSLAFSLFSAGDHETESSGYKATGYGEFTEEKGEILNRGMSLTHLADWGGTFLRTTLSASNYSNRAETNEELHYDKDIYASNMVSILSHEVVTNDIKDISLQSRLELTGNRYVLKTGVEGSVYKFNPGRVRTQMSDSVVNHVDSVTGYGGSPYSSEISAYLSGEFQFSSRFRAEMGLRSTAYMRSDTSYFRFEPRLAVRYIITPKISVKANYTVMNQFNHVVVENQSGMEKELWVTSTRTLKPEHAEQVSLGVFWGDDARKANISVEGFYKRMNNLIEYCPSRSQVVEKRGFDESIVRGGRGRAYGLEFMGSVEIGDANINLSYTLSRNERQYANLNYGRWYRFVYDRTHDLSLVAHYRLNDKWSFSSNFVMTSGARETLPDAYVGYDSQTGSGGYFMYSALNNYRLPMYHRLDVASTYRRYTSSGHRHQWTLNIFNIYARKNATRVFFDRNSLNMQKMAMLSILPTLTFTFSL